MAGEELAAQSMCAFGGGFISKVELQGCCGKVKAMPFRGWRGEGGKAFLSDEEERKDQHVKGTVQGLQKKTGLWGPFPVKENGDTVAQVYSRSPMRSVI